MWMLGTISNDVLRIILSMLASFAFLLFLGYVIKRAKITYLKIGYLIQFLGLCFNTIVSLANNAKMPALNQPYFQNHTIPMTSQTFYNWLGDRFFGTIGASIGDIILAIGFIFIVIPPLISYIYSRLRDKRDEQLFIKHFGGQ